MLGTVYALDLTGCQGIVDISNLKNVFELITYNCQSIVAQELDVESVADDDDNELLKANDVALMEEMRRLQNESD